MGTKAAVLNATLVTIALAATAGAPALGTVGSVANTPMAYPTVYRNNYDASFTVEDRNPCFPKHYSRLIA
jgi:hypothetical protein